MRLLCMKSLILFKGEIVSNVDGAAHMPRKPLRYKNSAKMRYTSGRWNDIDKSFTPAIRGDVIYIAFNWPIECNSTEDLQIYLTANGLDNQLYLHVYSDLDETPKSVHVVIKKQRGKEDVK